MSVDSEVSIYRTVCTTIVIVVGIISLAFLLNDWLPMRTYVANGFCPQTIKRELPSSTASGYWYWETQWAKCPAEQVEK